MKKIVSMLFILALLTGTALAATFTSVSIDYPVIVNGTVLSFTDALPMNYNGRTMLPLRAVSEALGVPITWDESKRQVTIQTIDTEALKNSCVMIYVGLGNGKATQGSGVFIDYDEVLTCDHVIDGGTYYRVCYPDGTNEMSTLTDSTVAEDAAVLDPPRNNVKPVKIGDSDEVNVGDTVYVVSSPKGEMNVVTTAKVSWVKQNVNGIMCFETPAITKGGSSGGAVFNVKGELVGIVFAGDSAYTSIAPINDVRKALAA